jgi:hypothetical protein
MLRRNFAEVSPVKRVTPTKRFAPECPGISPAGDVFEHLVGGAIGGQGMLVVPLPPSWDGPQPAHKNEPRPTPGLPRVGYLTFALAAAAVTAEGSAKAITASPSAKLVFGLPPKP